jgi:nudix motif 8
MALHEDNLRRHFDECKNGQGLFPLLNKHQTLHFEEHVQWETGATKKRAAVLVLICLVDGHPSLLFTRRAANLRQHAAEISFPGGHVEELESCVDAALRETCEELLPPDGFLSNLQIIGCTTPLPSIRGTPVTAVLAVSPNDLKDIHELFPGDPNEVDVVFSVSITDLVKNEGSHRITNSRFGDTLAPTFQTPHGKIWGLTAFVLRPILHKVLKHVYCTN